MIRRAHIHLMRWAPADYLASRVRGRSLATNDPMLRLVYLEALNVIHAAGGTLPNDPSFLADALGLDQKEIERVLPILLDLGRFGRGGLFEVEGEIQNRRVSEDLAAAEVFRQEQAAHGRKGALVRQRPEGIPSMAPQGQPEATLQSATGSLGLPLALKGNAKARPRRLKATPSRPHKKNAKPIAGLRHPALAIAGRSR